MKSYFFTQHSYKTQTQSSNILQQKITMSSYNQLSLFSTILLFLLLASILSAEKCHPDDKKTLFKIKKAFNNADMFASWTHDTDCCEWYLVSCDETTNRIISLSVNRDDEVAGHIPDTVGDLPYLEQLIFTDLPKLTGPIPQTISKLKNLKFLWLSHNNLTGSIPDFFGRLTKLTYINLSVNKLTGPIPPSVSSLHKLGALFLERNQLKGTIPASFGGFKNNPDFYLKLAKNQLYGPLPKSLGAVNFSVLDLNRNMFTGDASMLFGTNKGLQSIDISRNKFSFDLSKVRFPKELNVIELSHNMIYGSIPPTLAKQEHIQSFNVSYNRLCGKIPSSQELKSVDKYSYAHNKCLCGSPLPPCKK
ncbi:polygalacturonase inhibitor-like [Chenopodium quinoa]|uniref:polygalacturonase inhibitor-like n=1 Tax=Chenopodium quinoa TaxID=63459 RepID=UPI000B77B0AF|nr:polygalacturonase inhibitor-like [Chenopodium quinoa]